jgi:hypothetical protein
MRRFDLEHPITWPRWTSLAMRIHPELLHEHEHGERGTKQGQWAPGVDAVLSSLIAPGSFGTFYPREKIFGESPREIYL